MPQAVELAELKKQAQEVLHALKRAVRRFGTGRPLPVFLATVEPVDDKQGRIVVYSAFCNTPLGQNVLRAAIDKARNSIKKEERDEDPAPSEG